MNPQRQKEPSKSVAREDVRLQLAGVRDFLQQDLSAEAAWLLEELLDGHPPSALLPFINELDALTAQTPSNARDRLGARVESLKKIQASQTPDPAHVLKKNLDRWTAAIGQPALIARTFADVASAIDSSRLQDLETLREDLERLIDRFQKKKRKALAEALRARFPVQAPHDPEDDGPIDVGLAIGFMVQDVRDILLDPAGGREEAFDRFSDLVNVFDKPQIETVRKPLEELILFFPKRQREALVRILVLRAGKSPEETGKPEPAEAREGGSDRAGKFPETAPPPVAVEPPEPAPLECPPVWEDPGPAVIEIDRDPDEEEDVEILGMKLTWHATERLRRRGITVEDIQAALIYGQNQYAQGAQFFRIGRGEIRSNPEEKKLLEKLNGLHVVCGGDRIITVYKNRSGARLKS